jgi:predicted phosphodiesterase
MRLLKTHDTIVVPDTHTPYEDKRALRLLKKCVKELQPRRVIFIGDWFDLYTCSLHAKNGPPREHSLRQELDYGTAQLHDVIRGVPEWFFLSGNHEWRLDRFLSQKAPELASTHPTVRDWARIPEKRWVSYMSHVQVGVVSYTHDLGFSGKHSMSQTLDAFGNNIVFGHTHRGGTFYEGDVKGRHRFAMNVGWLGDPGSIDYMHRAKTRHWQQGLGLVTQDGRGRAWAQFCPIVDGRVVVKGVLIT